jgi:hypothetical protein
VILRTAIEGFGQKCGSMNLRRLSSGEFVSPALLIFSTICVTTENRSSGAHNLALLGVKDELFRF